MSFVFAAKSSSSPLEMRRIISRRRRSSGTNFSPLCVYVNVFPILPNTLNYSPIWVPTCGWMCVCVWVVERMKNKNPTYAHTHKHLHSTLTIESNSFADFLTCGCFFIFMFFLPLFLWLLPFPHLAALDPLTLSLARSFAHRRGGEDVRKIVILHFNSWKVRALRFLSLSRYPIQFLSLSRSFRRLLWFF